MISHSGQYFTITMKTENWRGMISDGHGTSEKYRGTGTQYLAKIVPRYRYGTKKNTAVPVLGTFE